MLWMGHVRFDYVITDPGSEHTEEPVAEALGLAEA